MKISVSNSSIILRKLTFAVTALFILAVTSCFNDVKLQPAVKTQDKKAYLCFSESTETFRKVIPADLTESDITKVTLLYRLSAADNTETQFTELKSWNGLSTFIADKECSLEPAAYDFKLDLYISSEEEEAEPVLVQSALNEAVKLAAGINYINFDAKYVQGKGNFELTLLWEDTVCIKGLKAAIFEKQQDSLSIGEVLNGFDYETLTITDDSAAGKKKAVYAKTDIPTGEYWFKVLVDNESQSENGGKLDFICDLIVIAPGITTSTEETLTEEQINRYYSVTYNLNGGEWAEGFTPVESHNKYQAVSLPGKNDILKEGRCFIGWITESGEQIEFIDTGTLHDTEINAVWGSKTEGTITVDAGNAYFSIEKTDPSKDYYLLTGDSLSISVSDKDGNPLEGAVIRPVLKFGGNTIPDIHFSYDEQNRLFTMRNLKASGNYQLFVNADYAFNGQTVSSCATFKLNVDFPTTLYVSENGNDTTGNGFSEETAFASITKATAFARKLAATKDTKSSFEIKVSGTITGPQSISSGENDIEALTLTGFSYVEDNPDTLVDTIDGNEEGTALRIEGKGSVRLNNLKITGGYLNNASPERMGGGIYINSDTTITNCEIINNTVDSTSTYYGNGGGIYSDSNLRLINSKVLNNSTGAYGGGIYITSDKILSLENSTLNLNSAKYGGAIYDLGTVLISGNTVIGNRDAGVNATADSGSGNTASAEGGAVTISRSELYLGYTLDDEGDIVEEPEHGEIKIIGNYAPKGGALSMNSSAKLVMATGLITWNGADESGEYKSGRGIYQKNASATNIPVIEMKGNARIAENNEVCLQNSQAASITITDAMDGTDKIAAISFDSPETKTNACVKVIGGLNLSDYAGRFSIPNITKDLTSTYGSNDIFTYSMSLDPSTAKPVNTGLVTYKEKPDYVGDFVFSTGGAVCKGAFDYMNSTQKGNIIAVIFYANGVMKPTATSSNPNPGAIFGVLNELDDGGHPLDNKILGVGLTYSDTAKSYYTSVLDDDTQEAVLALKEYGLHCEPLAQNDTKSIVLGNSSVTNRVTKFEGYTDGMFAFNSLVSALDDPKTPGNEFDISNFPAFEYAENYGNVLPDNTIDEYKTGWYIPSIAELSAYYMAHIVYSSLYSNYTRLNNLKNKKYWSVSLNESAENATDAVYGLEIKSSSNSIQTFAPTNDSDIYALCIRDFTND